MCGIAGTIYKKNYLPGKEINIDELEKVFHAVQTEQSTVDNFLELCWLYKSNINFLRYFRDKSERNKVKELSKQIKIISKSWLKAISQIDKRKSSEYFTSIDSERCRAVV